MVALEAFRREVEIFTERNLGEAAQKEIFIAASDETLDQFEDAWRARLQSVSFERFVDGRLTENLDAVRFPGGVIAERVVALAALLDRALELFDSLTKVVTGGYKSQTHVFDASGGKILGRGNLSGVSDLILIGNVSPFARKAERQGFNINGGAFSDGLFETIAFLLAREFGDTANAVYFTFRELEGERVPVLALGGAARFGGRRRGSSSRRR